MTKFNPQRDELLGSPCLSYQVQFRLPSDARSAFAKLSSQLRKSVPSGLWIAPPETLHVTCYSLVSACDDTYDKDQYWRDTSSLAVESLRRIVLQVPAFRLRFGAIRATDRAVVVLADHEPSVAMARTSFSTSIPQPGASPPQHYDTIHASLCRYEDPTSIPSDLPRIVADLRPNIPAEIDTLMLVRETIYPSIKNETLLSASLARIGPHGPSS